MAPLESQSEHATGRLEAAGPSRGQSGGLPKAAGLGLRREHIREVLAGDGAIGFVEIHAENYMSAGGPTLELLDDLARLYPISLHGVALSLGGMERPDSDHLNRLRTLIDRVSPAAFSEHLAWSSHDGVYFNDLLPVGYNSGTLERICSHIDEVQDRLGTRLLLENPSTYLNPQIGDLDEVSFLDEISERTGCGLLLDINNVFVSTANHGWDPGDYLKRFPLHKVGEIHLAGHEKIVGAAGEDFLLDSHGDAVSEAVWSLYADVIAAGGPKPTLIERDNHVPDFSVIAKEVERAAAVLSAVRCWSSPC